jgi:hypothetical protein
MSPKMTAPSRVLYVTPRCQKPPYTEFATHAAVKLWPPQFILIRLRQLARLKLQPRELLATLRELAREYKAFLAGNAVRQDD